MSKKSETEIRAYQDALKRYQGCSSVEINRNREGMLELIAWALGEEGYKKGFPVKNELELRAYREALLKYKGCCSTIEKNQYLNGELEALEWILCEKEEDNK